MGAMMMISMVLTITRSTSGTSSAKEIFLSGFMTFIMVISMVLFPILIFRYQKRQKKKYEAKRQEKYKAYLNSKNEAIHEIMTKQRNILFNNYLTANECVKLIQDKSPRLWERKIEDPDFLSIRLGIR